MNGGNVEDQRTVQAKENTVAQAIQDLHQMCDNVNGIAYSLEDLKKRICGEVYKTDDELIKAEPLPVPTGLVEQLELISFVLEETLCRMKKSTYAIHNTLGE